MKLLTFKPLLEFIASRRNTPFEWGVNDCCLFPADALKVLTGIDHASEFRGKYDSELGAAKALKKFGAGDLESTLTQKFGQPIAPLSAMRGDVALIDIDGNTNIGLVFGNVFCPGDNGLIEQPLSFAKCAWRTSPWASR